MRSIILISEDRVKTVSNLDNNVFGKWLLPAIREAQDVNLQSIIGSTLYNQILTLVDSGDIALPEYDLYKDLLDNQIADFLIYQSLVNVIPLINVNMANMGTVISNDEHIQTLSQGNVDLVRGYYQNLADIYQKRLQDFLKCHREYFPELNDCACDNCGVKPNLNSNTNTSGIWLGGLRNPRKGFVSSECCGGSSKSSSTDCQEEYNRGFRDGKTQQKSLLVATAFTENGNFKRENGWSGVTVNVPQTGHTDEELEQAYESGYTSGETHQKSLLVATAFTQNGTYSRTNGWSGVTVNVPQTGQTINNQILGTTLNSNGFYQFTYQSGYTGLERVDVTVDVAQTGYTQEDLDNAYQSGYTSGVTDGENQQKAKLVSTAFTENGTYTRTDGWSGVTVNVNTTIRYNKLIIDFSQSERVSGLTNNAIVTINGGKQGGTSNYTFTGSNIVVNLLPGLDYTITYGDVPNYDTPSSYSMTTKWGTQTTIQAIYDYIESTLSVSPSTIEYGTTGGSTTISITSNRGWRITNYPNWLTLSATAGTGNDTITATASSTSSDRSGTISFETLDGEQTATVSVSQVSTVLEVSPEYLYYVSSGASKTFTITSNGSWTITGKPSWLTLSTTAGTGNATVTATTSSNSGILRKINLTISDGSNSATVVVEQEKATTSDYLTQYLTFNIRTGGTISWTNTDSASTDYVLEYNLNDTGWNTIHSVSGQTTDITVNAGDKIYFRGDNSGYGEYSQSPVVFALGGYPHFTNSSSCVFSVYGNIMSMVDSIGFETTASTKVSQNQEFALLFMGCEGLLTAENLKLPSVFYGTHFYYHLFDGCNKLKVIPALSATTVTERCYSDMFSGCLSITTVPSNILPATTLADFCYASMFYHCCDLSTLPALPATTLADGCYSSMFEGACNITTIPSNYLPATSLKTVCYAYMFRRSGVETAPTDLLPATTLAQSCYANMFDGCSNLTQAPYLPALTLVIKCYYEMFNMCTRLNYLKCLATDKGTSVNTTQWLYGVAENGTFVKNPSMEDWNTSPMKEIPTTWTIIDA